MKRLFMALLVISLSLSCGKDDPCENIDCGLHGTCANGVCNCEEGWSGSDCSQKQTPDHMLIKRVVVTKFPATESNGAGWDLFDGPDVTVSVRFNGSSIADATTYYENATQGSNYTFDFNPGARINNPTARYVISLYDYDTDTDDYMGGIEFTPFSTANPTFPETLELDFSGSKVAFTLTVEYVF